MDNHERFLIWLDLSLWELQTANAIVASKLFHRGHFHMDRELNKTVLNTLLGLRLLCLARYNFSLQVTSTETLGSGHDPR